MIPLEQRDIVWCSLEQTFLLTIEFSQSRLLRAPVAPGGALQSTADWNLVLSAGVYLSRLHRNGIRLYSTIEHLIEKKERTSVRDKYVLFFTWKHEFCLSCQGNMCLLPLMFCYRQSGREKAPELFENQLPALKKATSTYLKFYFTKLSTNQAMVGCFFFTFK